MSAPTLAHADAAARLRVAVTRLIRHLRQTAPGDLTLSQWSALATIEAQGQVRIGDLAERERVSAATATRLVASLEERGLVTRSSDEADRRSWFVSLTAAGRAKLDSARRARTQQLAQRLSALAPDELERLLEALPVLESLTETD